MKKEVDQYISEESVRGFSYIGSRPRNEDRIGYLKFAIGELDAHLLMVCDGMGGHSKGDEAAAKTIEIISSEMSEPRFMDGMNAISRLENALHKAHDYMLRKNLDDKDESGTTVVTALVCGNYAAIHHVGDSRAYLHHNGDILQLTKDHSKVQKLIDSNIITPKEAPFRSDTHIILKGVGIMSDTDVLEQVDGGQIAKSELEFDTGKIKLHEGDKLMLLSDGLTEGFKCMDGTKLMVMPGKLLKSYLAMDLDDTLQGIYARLKDFRASYPRLPTDNSSCLIYEHKP